MPFLSKAKKGILTLYDIDFCFKYFFFLEDIGVQSQEYGLGTPLAEEGCWNRATVGRFVAPMRVFPSVV